MTQINRILVVEDESVVAIDLQNRLEKMGYDASSIATNGHEALHLVEQLPFDLILMDIILEGEMDGIQASELIQENYHIPVIFITAYSDDRTLKRARRTMPFGYILKPFDDRDLKVNIEMALYKYRMESSLRDQMERLTLAARGANDGFWDWDLNENRMHYSPRWLEMVGEVQGNITTSPDEWFKRVHPDDVERVHGDVVSHIEGQAPHFESEHRIKHKNGEYRWVYSRGLCIRDSEGKAYRIAGSQTDVNDRRVAEEQLLYYAFHDPLTDLPNRLLLLDRLSRVLRRNAKEKKLFALLLLDLDRFRTINHILGSKVGDQLLNRVAKRITSCLRIGDTAARVGNDRFAVILNSINDSDEAERFAIRLSDKVNFPYNLENASNVMINTSMGLAICDGNPTRPDQVLTMAESSLNNCKQQSLLPRFHINTGKRQSESQFLEELSISPGNARKVVGMIYQPIFNLENMEVSCIESLLRIRHPDNYLMMPYKFLPLASEFGVMDTFQVQAMRSCFEFVKRLQKEGFHHPVSINITGELVRSPEVFNFLTLLGESEPDAPSSLILEISRMTGIEDSQNELRSEEIQNLKKLESLGYRFSLDSYGINLSPPGVLQNLNIFSVKLDRSLISKISDDHHITDYTNSIIEFSRRISSNLVAVGIETAGQMDFMWGMGCNFFQGALLCPPLNGKSVIERLHKKPDLSEKQLNFPGPCS